MCFYLLIAVVLLMTIFALRGGMGNQEKVTYARCASCWSSRW